MAEDWRKDFPLYPPLKEEAVKEAQDLMDDFKKRLLIICKDTLSQFYCDVAMYIESDSWTNFRNEVMREFSEYGNRKLQGEYAFAQIREEIFREYRDEIIKECQEDIVKENKRLTDLVKYLQENRY